MRITIALGTTLVLTACAGHTDQLGTMPTSDGGHVDSAAPVSCGAATGKPIVLASEQIDTINIAVDSTNVYWTNNGENGERGGVMDVPLCGGTPVTVFAGQGNVLGVALNSSSVFWSLGYFPAGILSAPLGGGTPVTVAEQNGLFVAADTTNVYWTVLSGPAGCDGGVCTGTGAVVKAPVAGGAVTTLASAQSPYGLALDSDSVYWTNFAGETSAILRVPIGGGVIATVASGAHTLFNQAVAVDATNVYWTVPSTLSSSQPNEPTEMPDGKVMKAPKSGGTPTTLASGRTGPNQVATDGTSVYWTESGPTCATPPCPGAVMKVDIAGGSAVTVAAGQTGPGAITVDSSSVYWVAGGPAGSGGSNVMKLTPK